MKLKNIVYLDSAANTFLDKKVFSAMLPYLKEDFMGNEHANHSHGVLAQTAVEKARQQISQVTGFNTKEIFFTSGATESNNWILQSLALHELYEEKAPKLHAVVSATEHSSIINVCKKLEKMGFLITYIQPDERGAVRTKDIRKALRYNTLFVCVMSVNNETGIKNPVNVIGDIAHKNHSYMISDCTQYLSYGGKCCNLKKKMPNVDYISLSGHKIYGPTGVGCVIARERVPLYPFIIGGGQEQGKRGGTSNTAGIVGLGEAFSLLSKESFEEKFNMLYTYLLDQLGQKHIPYKLNAIPDHKNIININCSSFMDDTELASTFSIFNISCSAGSACDSLNGNAKPSHVLLAMGLSEHEIHNSVRVSFSKRTSTKDLDKFIAVLEDLYKRSQK